ncbi:MAG: DEAD/DEAH box helicase [Eubacteriales bacterium]|nr:DEAD/DEAH box helicase [Eubacteriales bacterium]
MGVVDALKDSLSNGFIDFTVDSLEKYNPKLLINDYRKGMKVLSSITGELENCKEFYFSVAFITNSGVESLLSVLDMLREKGLRGKIVTSQYQDFTEPVALRRLLRYGNIELRIVTDENLHSKGYIFKRTDDTYSFIVGSSNLTQNALSLNKEWNLKLSSMEEGALFKSLLREFDETFSNATVVTDLWIREYEKIYKAVRSSRKNRLNDASLAPILNLKRIYPNKMQSEALRNIEKLRDQGEDKALLISATGTGKTYLSAFDVAVFRPKKFLYVVHRENIAKAAMKSYKNVIGHDINAGLLSGNSKEFDCDYVFAMVQTISKEDVLREFTPDYFDYIVIDEVHRAGADSYNKVVEYFKPKFLLGMTASPERTDGLDIFSIFDHNIAYEIRLQKAMEENLLCPFHYFGISDLEINGEFIDDYSEFRFITSEERVNNIIEKIEYYGYSGDRVKGLIFCSRNDEAAELSVSFNEKGYKTIALSGENTSVERENAIQRLEQDNEDGALDYIFTVDIFNEGIDIPAVNQIVMLRPTESAIIFVQQLGRGLRKYQNKEFVVVVDFIANYRKSFLIPVALSGDRTYNKDTIRRFVREGTRVIPGCSTVNFDAISKRRIYESIDTANFNDVKLIKDSYFNLKYKLGRIPKLMDFEEHGEIDVLRIFENSSLGSYYKFLKKYDKQDYNVTLTLEQEKFVEFISRKLANGKRPHELEFLKRLIKYETGVMSIFQREFQNQYNIEVSSKTKKSIVNILTNEFMTGSGKNTYSDCIFIEPDGKDYKISSKFCSMIKSEEFLNIVNELIDFGLYRNKKFYGDRYQNTSFSLYSKYTYEDVCRILEWEQNQVPFNIGGYKYDKKTNTFPVFINYEKEEDISATTAYEDRFINQSLLIALSKSGRTPDSEDVKVIYSAVEKGVDIQLFVRKNKDDKMSKEFYYLGRINAIGRPKPVKMKGTDKSAVEITYKLETPVREDIYQYIIS